jgi:hypothetical protein
MVVEPEKLFPFREICRKICLNIPTERQWLWDQQRDLAWVTLEKEETELVYFPLLREFKDRWSFQPEGLPETLIAQLLDSEYGLMPGQTFFATPPIEGWVLFVAWWPWGQAGKVSMRVGLLPMRTGSIPTGFTRSCLSCWLPIGSRSSTSAGHA